MRSTLVSGPPSVVQFYLARLVFLTKRESDIIDITANVEEEIVRAGITHGVAFIHSLHTTCSVILNERESGLLDDLREVLCRLVPSEFSYAHDDFAIRVENMHPDETKNAYAHLRQMLVGATSLTLPVANASLQLGEWQRVMVVEFDRARRRQFLLQLVGA